MAGRGSQYQCDTCGRTFSCLCHWIQHTSYLKCAVNKKGNFHDNDDMFDRDIFLDDDDVVLKQYSKDHEEKLRRTKVMHTPMLHQTEISGAKRRL